MILGTCLTVILLFDKSHSVRSNVVFYTYSCLRVDHTKEFVAEKGVHTNNIENLWGTLKRGILGIYHHVSAKHLQKYVDEFCFRYNNRSNVNMFNLLVKQTIYNSQA